jgi:hypothetical protein
MGSCLTRLSNQKAPDKRPSDVDLAGLTPASLGVNSNMLLHTPQAQVHGFILKQKELFFKNSFCDTQLLPAVRAC